MEFHFMYQLVYNHYFKKGIFSSLCALEAKNSKSVPFTELSRLAKFTLPQNVSKPLDVVPLRWSEKWKSSKKSLACWFSSSFTKL